MTTGLTTNVIVTEIQSIHSTISHVESVWGFGSFFRHEPYNDIDLLFVVSCSLEDLFNTSQKIREEMKKMALRIDQEIHLLVLTPEEFAERPLHDFGELVLLSGQTAD